MSSDYDYTRTTGTTGATGTAGTTGTTGSTGASSAPQRVAEKAGEVKDRVSEKAGEVKDRAAQATHQAAERVDSAMTATGEKMSGLAQTLRERAPEGQAGEVAHNAARALERGGDYLQRADPNMVRSDLENVIRDHPIEALAISLGIGFLIGKSMNNRRNYYG